LFIHTLRTLDQRAEGVEGYPSMPGIQVRRVPHRQRFDFQWWKNPQFPISLWG